MPCKEQRQPTQRCAWRAIETDAMRSGCVPEVHFEPVREELLVAVGAGNLVRQAVLAELILHNAIGGQHHISLLKLLYAGLPLVAMVYHHLSAGNNVLSVVASDCFKCCHKEHDPDTSVIRLGCLLMKQ